jgi:hypothetical protein
MKYCQTFEGPITATFPNSIISPEKYTNCLLSLPPVLTKYHLGSYEFIPTTWTVPPPNTYGTMGLTESLTQAVLIPINVQISERGLAVVAAVGFVSFIALAVVLNVLSQLLPQNPNEPPLVFHWFPILGNTISYGMDPYPFFFKCREKVRKHESTGRRTKLTLVVW